MAKIQQPTGKVYPDQKTIQNKTVGNSLKRQNEASCANVSRKTAKKAVFGDVEDDIKLRQVTTIESTATLLKRGRGKYITVALAFKLIDASKLSDKSELRTAYWRTVRCCQELTEFTSGKISSKYCKNRWCMVCMRIKTAQMINKYHPWIKKHSGNIYMLTLSRPTVDAYSLKKEIEIRNRACRKMQKKIQLRRRRKGLPKMEGIRKLECTVRPGGMYHPHYHIVIVGREDTEEYRREWVKEFPECNPEVQKIVKCTPGSEMELFKYFTKIITDRKGDKPINANALDVIFNAVKGKRVYQSIGFKLPKAIEESEEITEEDYAVASWIWDKTDWITVSEVVDMDTAEVLTVERKLTGYKPCDKFRELVENGIYVDKNFKRNPKSLVKQIKKVTEGEQEAKDLDKTLEQW